MGMNSKGSAISAGNRGEGIRSDCFISLELPTKGGIQISLKSKVERMFGKQIRAQIMEVLETLDPTERLQKLSIILAKELSVLELEDEIHSQVQQEVDRSQREFFLREPNSGPMKGMRLRYGTPLRPCESCSEIKPPRKTVCPDCTATWLVTVWLLIGGLPLVEMSGSRAPARLISC